jgi:hypothetical protein
MGGYGVWLISWFDQVVMDLDLVFGSGLIVAFGWSRDELRCVEL